MTAFSKRSQAVPSANRSTLMLSCAVVALSIALPLQHASAQAAESGGFQGTPAVASGTVGFERTSNSQTIYLESPTATLSWSPFDSQGTGTIDFLPQGHTATFQGSPELSDFTVLNRIIPTDPSRPVAINGTVISQLMNGSNSVTSGGNVWFYSPGGLIIGATAVFNVGGLLLTVNNPISWSTTATGFSANFARADSSASVAIHPGASISAVPENSYVAIVAPRIEQGGSVWVNGAASYVAAQDATLTMNQGLFDIQVDVGTGDANGVVHTGATGGPSSSGAGDNHRIYMVAIPKNQALTMLLAGNAGFGPATVAEVENGEIVLRSGWESTPVGTNDEIRNPSAIQSNLIIGPGNYTSDVSAVVTGNAFAQADTGSLDFSGSLSLSSYSSNDATFSSIVHVGASNGHSIAIGDSLSLDGRAPASIAQVLLSAESGGSVSVGGDATLHTIVQGGSRGFVGLTADAGDIQIAGQANMIGGSIDVQIGGGSEPASLHTGSFSATVHGGEFDLSVGAAATAFLGFGNIQALADGDVGFLLAGSGPSGALSAFSLLVQAGGDVQFSTHGSAIYVHDNFGISSGGSVAFTSLGLAGAGSVLADSIHIDAFDFASDFPLNAHSIDISTIGNLSTAALSASSAITAESGATMQIGSAEAGDSVMFEAGGDFVASGPLAADWVSLSSAGSMWLDDVTAESSIFLDVGNVLTLNGLVAAPFISAASADLAFGAEGQLGVLGVTELLELFAYSDGAPIVIGGDGGGGELEAGELGQYELSQQDAERIEGSNIVFTAVGVGGEVSPDVVVRDLVIEGSGGGEGVTSVKLITPGKVTVVGDLAYIDAAANDALSIFAGERLQVITPDGSIRMVGTDAKLAGTLTLNSPNIIVTDADLADSLAQNPNFEGRNEALSANSGPVNPAGYLGAGGIQLLTTGNIFIQNTGTTTEFAGLTVGGGGLLIGRLQVNPGASMAAAEGPQSFSFTGTLTTADEVLFFDFTVTSESMVTLRTYSYAGGTNAAGQSIPAGGFDPILALFNAAGALIGQNDDGGSNVPADPATGLHYDTFLQQLLPPGEYTVSVTAYSNFANGPNLSDGFEGGGSFNGRSPNWAFDVLGANTATGPGETGPITVVAFGRMQNQDGSTTGGAQFFQMVDFGIDSGVEYSEGSSFNGFLIGQPIPEPPPPPPPPEQPNPPALGDFVLGPVQLSIELISISDNLFGEGVIGWSDEGGEGEGDSGGRIGVPLSSALSNSDAAAIRQALDEAVTSGGDSSLWFGGPDEDEDEEEQEAEEE